MPSNTKGRLLLADPELDRVKRPLLDLVPVRVVRLAELMARLASETIESTFGLRNTDLRILNWIESADGITVNEISRRAHVDKAWVSRCLRHLEKEELVTRKGNRKDSRLTVVRLTRKGSDLLEQIRPIALAREARLLAGIDTVTFKASLDRLMLNAAALLERS